jgi:transcriptional regulator with XRE-family HTH domain
VVKLGARGGPMANLAELIGNRIRELRKQKGLRQEDMQRFGINHKYYQRVETGKANVTLSTIEKIARALGMDAKDLFLLPLDPSKETSELAASLRELIKKRDRKAIRKLNLFVKEFL